MQIENTGPSVDRASWPRKPIWSPWQLRIAMMVLFQGGFCRIAKEAEPPQPVDSLGRRPPERGRGHTGSRSTIARNAQRASRSRLVVLSEGRV